MAEPENFEEDLFADLYDGDDNTSKPATTAPEVQAEPEAPTQIQTEETAPAEEAEQNGDGDQHMYNGEDEDDDIDFNLGNDNGYDAPATHEAHGPGIKEDG